MGGHKFDLSKTIFCEFLVLSVLSIELLGGVNVFCLNCMRTWTVMSDIRYMINITVN